MKIKRFFGLPSQIMLGLFLLLVTILGQAQSLTLSNQYHFRHTDSRYNNDNHYIGVTASPNANGGTTVSASQGAANLSMTDTGNGEFFVSTPYNSSLTGSWQLNAQNGAETVRVQTNAIGKVGPMPFVQNLATSGGLPTPTLIWTLPVTSEPFTQTRVRIYDGVTNNQIGDTFPVGLNTSFIVPAGLLDSNGRYNFRIMLENIVSDVLVNRSSTYTSLPAQGVIRGQVYQINGTTAIGGATVEALGVSSGAPYLTPTSTNATGSYSLSLPAGSYRVRAKAPGYAREYFDNVTPSNEATVLNVTDGSSTTANFNLNEGGAIAGHIYQSDGVTPIANAEVFIRLGNFFFDDGFRVGTASNGSYVVDGLSLGQFKVTALASGYANLKYYGDKYGWDNATNVSVIPPSSVDNINIKLDLGASISGYIYATDGVTPLNNVGILADPQYGGFEGIGDRSKVDGSYAITGLPPYNYLVRIADSVLPGWYVGEYFNSKDTAQQAGVVSVAPGQNVTDINFTLDEGGIITGQVFDDETKQPISGIALWTSTISGGYPAGLGNTNFEGKYQLRFKPGQYLVQTGRPSGYISEWYNDALDINNATPINVYLKQVTSGIDFYLSRPGSISGWVHEKDGTTPIAGATVYAFPINPQVTGSGANTGPDGNYKYQGLATGNYVAQVTVTGHVSANTPVNVTAPNETPNINFSLDTYPYAVKIIGQGVVGQQGGSVRVSDTSSPLLNAGVDVPAGALSDNTVINIGEVDAPALPPGLIGIGAPVHFGPEGLQFAQPVTLKIPYKQEDIINAGITDPNQLEVYTFNITNLTWMLVQGTKTVDTVNRLVMIAVDHFSIFRLAALSSSTFGTFSVNPLRINQRLKTLFLLSNFTLRQGSDGISPVTEPVKLAIANFTTTIPAGSFRKGRTGVYAFAGKINNVAIEALITPLGGNRFGFQAAAYGANLSRTKNPVKVELMIGDDSGTTLVNNAVIIR